MAPVMAGVLARRNADAWVVRGDDGLDELTTTSTSTVWLVRDGEVTIESIDPSAYGFPRVEVEALRGGDAAFNADVVRRLLDGETGPVRDAVLLNAGAALAVYHQPEASVADSLAAGIERAAEAVDSGAAKASLDAWVTAASE